MTNNIIFIIHVFSILFMIFGALFFGKEALISLVSIFAISANLFVLKQITLFGFQVTCSDAFIVGCVLGVNLIQEYFGYKEARKAVWISFFCSLCYLFLSQVHLFYLSNSFDTANAHYVALLSCMPRIIIASVFTYLTVQLLDTLFYRFLKQFFYGKFLVVRSVISLLVSQLLDTIIFSYLGLYGLVGSIFNVMLVSYLIKVLIIVLSAPIIFLTKKILKSN